MDKCAFAEGAVSDKPYDRARGALKLKLHDGGKKAAGFDWENRDCAVRAISLFADRSYATVHQMLKQAGRKDKRGTYSQHIAGVIKSLTDVPLIPVNKTQDKAGRYVNQLTLNQLIKQNQKGRLVVLTRGHALAVIDGVIHDTFLTGGRSRVWSYFIQQGEEDGEDMKMKIDLKQSIRDFISTNKPLKVSQMIQAVANEYKITKANARYYVVRVFSYRGQK